ncbi:MAG: nitroreductase, partial [Actinomycetota bacterium]
EVSLGPKRHRRADLDTYEAIMTRKSVSPLEGPSPTGAQIVQLLNAAVRAPSHHLTQSWRFIAVTAKALDDLGDVFATRVQMEDPDAPDLERRLADARSQPHRAPAIIVAVYRKSSHPKAVEVEDRYAIGAAVQNLLLAAHSMGLGTYWRTGPNAFDEGVKSHLGLTQSEEIAGFIYVGHLPADASNTAMAERTPAEEVTTWLGF